MKKRKFAAALISVAIAASILLAGTALAYMFRRTETKVNTFDLAEVSCSVSESFSGDQKTSITVTNIGNINAFVRVRLVSYWLDAEGNVAPKNSIDPTVNLGAGWFRGSDGAYYYRYPVGPGSASPNLISSGTAILLSKDGDYKQVIEVFAEAVQSLPANAVTESWPVNIDGDGNLSN